MKIVQYVKERLIIPLINNFTGSSQLGTATVPKMDVANLSGDFCPNFTMDSSRSIDLELNCESDFPTYLKTETYIYTAHRQAEVIVIVRHA